MISWSEMKTVGRKKKGDHWGNIPMGVDDLAECKFTAHA